MLRRQIIIENAHYKKTSILKQNESNLHPTKPIVSAIMLFPPLEDKTIIRLTTRSNEEIPGVSIIPMEYAASAGKSKTIVMNTV